MIISHEILAPDIVLVRLEGRLDAVASQDFKALLSTLMQQGYLKLIIDFEQVPFIDSSGLVALVSGLRLARQYYGQILLSGIQPQAQTVFRMTMLDRLFSIHPTIAEARTGFS